MTVATAVFAIVVSIGFAAVLELCLPASAGILVIFAFALIAGLGGAPALAKTIVASLAAVIRQNGSFSLDSRSAS